ncbi:MAG: hypothetical protein U9Q97_04085 [Acidobacteriota bacterium]|nr:hypothetical protein [Acidobacteriota bacterium]
MSGGYFDYQQYQIRIIHDEIENVIENNRNQEIDQFGDPLGRNYPDDIIESFTEALKVLRIAEIYAQRIDWLLSGDDGEESYRNRLMEDLNKDSVL